MAINEDTKKWIDEASYHSLLERWRNAPVGSSLFQGETGKYYSEVMKKKREEVGQEKAVQTSKSIGW